MFFQFNFLIVLIVQTFFKFNQILFFIWYKKTVCFVLLICVFWFYYTTIIKIWIHFCVFFIFHTIAFFWIMRFLNVSTTFDHDLFIISKKFTLYLYFKKKKFIFIDVNFHLFNVNFVIKHNLIQFFWSYDVKILIYVFIMLFVFFIVLFICEWYVVNSFYIIFNNLQMIFQICFTNYWFLFNIIICDNSCCWKVIYTKIHVTFSTQICFMNLKIMFLLNLSMIIMKFV